ncbi:LIM domain-containing protein C4F6.12 [Ceratocystis lukuohia]|uniref:LIM domain-containing protein C4F6.12 n=1 Tax=Ceratocystis lukuohia TaxID=2019550 RepID=A0ABR4MN91_9PEZI
MFKSGSQHRRKVTPPSPTYMKDDQFAAYLAGLRNSRQARPAGARELPADSRQSRNRMSMGSTATAATSSSTSGSSSASASTSIAADQASFAQSRRTAATDASTINGSVRSRYSTSSQAKDYYPSKPVSPLRPSEVVPSTTYIERGSRWMEKEEAHSLRQAMEALDMRDSGSQSRKSTPPTPTASAFAPPASATMGSGSIAASLPRETEEDERIYNSALHEASELVWQHQNGVVPNPDAPYAYRPHMRKHSYAHARTAAAGLYGDDIAPSGLARDSVRSRSVSNSSEESDYQASRRSRSSSESARQGIVVADESSVSPTDYTQGQRTSSKSYSGLNSGKYAPGPRRRSSMKRNISGEINRPFSGEQIWEEPESRNQSPAKPAPPPVSNVDLPVGASVSSRPSYPRSIGPRPLDSGINARPLPAPVKPFQRNADEPLSRVEIHRNPPSQSRNPMYTQSSKLGSTPGSSSASPSPPPPSKTTPMTDVPRKNGVEIRSDDVRNATRIRLQKDRKIPTPTAVSDNPGRPIVSFDANWTPPDESTDKRLGNGRSSPPSSTPSVPAIAIEGTGISDRRDGSITATKYNSDPISGSSPTPYTPRQRSTAPDYQPRPPMATPSISVSPEPSSSYGPPDLNATPASSTIPSISIGSDDSTSTSNNRSSVPSISVSADVPSINISNDDPPAINVSSVPSVVAPSNDGSSESKTPAVRPLPTPTGVGGARALPRHPRHHWSPAPGSIRRGMTLCHECGLPIEGRFISLAGSREKFHPTCFACYSCGTNLEALEISPEPEDARGLRLERIRLRNTGHLVPDEPGKTAIDDGDDRLRFFCHLDWHEQFAPRCKHCKTPILGEHMVALGSHWHYGHFFCAECGDPFEHGMTHIEKDGYAWCVRCQTRRTERRAPKCKKCKLAVIGQYIQALGGEWHEACFRCATCDGSFDDGQIFPVPRDNDAVVVLCTQCRMRELKI